MMNRDEIQTELYRIFYEQFEIEAPDPDDDLPEAHGFDSIDAIELLVEIEKMLDITLSQEQKKEEYEMAKKRGAPVLAEVIGFSCNNNGGELILPNLDGICQTIRLGLKDAGIAPDAVDYVSAHATGTKMGDGIEAKAIETVYGAGPRVSGLKSYMGHTMASCGVIESILTLYMMEKGFIAPTHNLEEVDPRCAAIRHVRQPEEVPIRIAAVQNFAFGGVNTSLFFKKPESAAGQ